MVKRTPGKALLQAVSIFLVVLGVFAAFSGAMSFGSYKMVDTSEALAETMQGEGVTKTMMLVSGIVSMIASLTYMVAGIFGIRYSNQDKKTKICMVLGVILLVEVLAEAGYQVFLGQFDLGGTVSGMILPLLYLWASYERQQAQKFL